MPPGNWEAGERGTACLPDRRGEFRDGIGLAIEYAKALSCPLVHAMAGLAPAGAKPETLRETYVENLRYAAAEARGREQAAAPIRSLKAYLTTIVTRLCLDRLKSAQTTREQYVGPWLPEPVMTPAGTADPQQNAERYESITMAFLVLLEALTPQERAVFLLREVFEYEYAEIAEVLGLSVVNCRQLFRRAKERVAEDRPRFRPSPERQRQLVQRFLAATQRGELQALTSMLAQDISFWADGGGKTQAARRPVHGRDAVAKLLIGIMRGVWQTLRATPEDVRLSITDVNGELALLVMLHDRLNTVFVISIAEEQIVALRVIRNPDKLVYLQHQLQASNTNGAPLA